MLDMAYSSDIRDCAEKVYFRLSGAGGSLVVWRGGGGEGGSHAEWSSTSWGLPQVFSAKSTVVQSAVQNYDCRLSLNCSMKQLQSFAQTTAVVRRSNCSCSMKCSMKEKLQLFDGTTVIFRWLVQWNYCSCSVQLLPILDKICIGVRPNDWLQLFPPTTAVGRSTINCSYSLNCCYETTADVRCKKKQLFSQLFSETLQLFDEISVIVWLTNCRCSINCSIRQRSNNCSFSV